jgi:hypothetical protein
MSFERLTVSFSDPDHFEDATEVYGDHETFPDEICRCVSIRGKQAIVAGCGGFRCADCGKVVGR